MQGKGREGLLQTELLCVCKGVCRASLGEGGLRAVLQARWCGSPEAPPGTVGPWHTRPSPPRAGGRRVSPRCAAPGPSFPHFPFQQREPRSWIASPSARAPQVPRARGPENSSSEATPPAWGLGSGGTRAAGRGARQGTPGARGWEMLPEGREKVRQDWDRPESCPDPREEGEKYFGSRKGPSFLLLS